MNVGKRIDESILKWRNKMLWLSMLFLSVSLFSDEVSVFGAGNLDDELPYGLNQTEKKIVENNNKIKKLKSKIKELKKENFLAKQKIKELENSLKSLQDYVQVLGKQNHEQKIKTDKLIEDLKQNSLITEINFKKLKDDVNKTKSQVENTKNETKKTLNQKIQESFDEVNSALEKQDLRLAEIEKSIKEDYKTLIKKIQSLERRVKKIKSNYVTQKQLNSVVESLNNFKETVLAEFENLAKKSDELDCSKHSNPDIFSKGKKAIQLGKYKEAIKCFNYLIKQHYRPATDNFYIGEANYFLARYELAIKHYKESVNIYDKSKFMPTLLLHSGVSLEKIHDIEQAKSFYKLLIESYPDTLEAKKARSLLSKL
jgi:TolA-binding protein